MKNSRQFLGINWVEEVGPAMIHMNIFKDQQFTIRLIKMFINKTIEFSKDQILFKC